MAPADLSAASDAQLIARVRAGDLEAYGELYARHISAAATVARKQVDNPADVEDVVAEAFQAVLQSLVAGKGPECFFRAYLLIVVARVSHRRNRKAARALPTSDESLLDGRTVTKDPSIEAFEAHTVARAFRSLPKRWQSVLWYLDVERMKPAAIAPILGLSPNAVSALGLRAREGLRRQYLQMHVNGNPRAACADSVSRLGSYVRGGLSKSAEAKVREHLASCAWCTAVLSELKDVQGTLRSVLLPVVASVPMAAWGIKAGALGVVGQLPAAPMETGVAGIAESGSISMVAVVGLAVVLVTLGVIEVFTEQSRPASRVSRRERASGT
ncbi:sigma-70 family RNA polymerase sigma factor [bacterium RCC_150]